MFTENSPSHYKHLQWHSNAKSLCDDVIDSIVYNAWNVIIWCKFGLTATVLHDYPVPCPLIWHSSASTVHEARRALLAIVMSAG